MTVSRPMLYFSASFLAGMYLLAFMGATVACTVLFCAVITTVVYICRNRNWFKGIVLFVSVIMFMVGTIVYGVHDNVKTKKLYPYVQQPITFHGEVTDKPSVKADHMQLKLKTESVCLENGDLVHVKESVLMTCFINEKAPAKIPIPKRGDVISISAKLTVPDGAMNIGGFDYASYLKTEGVFFQAIGDTNTLKVTGHIQHPVLDFVYGLRENCAVLLESVFPEQECGVLKAYILGDDTDMDDEITTVFSRSGLTHVLAVSGSHVVVFLAVIMMFLVKLRIPKRGQLFLSAFLVILYVIFTGMSVSAVRAGFVCFVSVLAQILYRRSDPITALFEAGAFLAVWNPASVCGASFMLSFAATLGILLFGGLFSEKLSFLYVSLKKGSKKRNVMKGVCDGLAIGIAAQIFTLLVTVGLFQMFSTTSVVATIILTPLLSPLLAGGLLFCMIGSLSTILAMPIAGFIYLLTKLMILIAKFFANIPFGQILYGGITPFFLLIYSLVVILFLSLVVKRRGAALVCIYSLATLSIVYLCHVIVLDAPASVTFINVGQGDCALIQAPGNCDILVDAGGKDGDYSIAEETIWPYLLKKGVRDIEYAVASHGHSDHINGLIGLLSKGKIKNLIVSKEFGRTDEAKMLLSEAEKKQVNIIRVRAGDRMEFENGLVISALAPDHKTIEFLSENENDISLLMKVQFGENAFLFTGDLSGKEEGYIASNHPEKLMSTVMKASHHGSKNANTESFLDVVNPRYIYIPVGENAYGHPDGTVLKRMQDRNIHCYRADVHGDVTFYMDQFRISGVYFQQRNIVGG